MRERDAALQDGADTVSIGWMPLLWRVLAINATLVVAATLTLAITPATVSDDLTSAEIEVLAVGVVLVLVLNYLLLRRALDPLDRLTRTMNEVDLLRPSAPVEITGGGSEVVTLSRAFNRMIDRLEDERRASGRRAIEAQEHERRRVAVELHDDVGQLLTGTVLAMDGLVRAVPEPLEPRVREVQDLVRQSGEHVRAIARGLRPQALDELGLRSALISLVATVTEQSRLPVRTRIAHHLPALSPEAELVVYRVAQESLHNVVRHAGATEAEIAVEVRDGSLVLEVVDDGAGISEAALRSSRGVLGMRERAFYVEGRLEIRRRPPRGTRVRLEVPVEETA